MIRTDDLTKRYGETLALDGVSLHVGDGSIYGLVGPNGAGKTTLLGVLSGLVEATSGSATIATERMAVLPDTPSFDPWLTAREVVDLARNLDSHDTPVDRVDELLRSTGIAEAADRPVGGFSRGMLQRLGLAATMVSEPELLLLDEPASALDPLGRREVLDLIAQLHGTATIVFSSHILADVQEVCDTIGILRQGKLLFEGPLHELLVGKAVPSYLVRLRSPVEPVISALRAEDWISEVTTLDPEQIRVTASSVGEAEQKLVPALTAAEAVVVSLVPEAPSLEDVFLDIVR